MSFYAFLSIVLLSFVLTAVIITDNILCTEVSVRNITKYTHSRNAMCSMTNYNFTEPVNLMKPIVYITVFTVVSIDSVFRRQEYHSVPALHGHAQSTILLLYITLLLVDIPNNFRLRFIRGY